MSELHWKDLLPVDYYTVKSNGLLQDYDRKVLTLLYQPLIGSLAFSLYMTLWSELEQGMLWGKEASHHGLMNVMQIDLKQIFKERIKLEGIGLLKTYVKDHEENKHFIYELQPPLTPQSFFNDGVLNVYLYNRIGRTKFNSFKEFFSTPVIATEQYRHVSRSFNEAFVSLHSTELNPGVDSEIMEMLEPIKGHEFIGKKDKEGVVIPDEAFDFDMLLAGLSEGLVPRKVFTPKNKEIIKKLAYVYRIDPLEMKKILISAVNENDQLDIDQLRKAARDWYQLTYNDTLPSLSDRKQPEVYRTMTDKEPKSQDEVLIKQLERVSPYQFLKEISGGAEPSVSDLQIIEEVFLKQKLHPGVINVLIYYVMLKSDMKLSKNYVLKIAAHWSRKRIRTVAEAIELAKKDHKQYQQWAESKESSNFGKKPIRKEMLPDWLKDKNKDPGGSESHGNDEDAKDELDRLLKKYNS